MTSPFLLFLTDFGDSGLLLALSCCSAFFVWYGGEKRTALALLAAYFCAAGYVGLLKLAFLGCGGLFRHPHIASPSGHAALSLAVYSIHGIIFGSRRSPFLYALCILIPIGFALIIALSRVVLEFHSAAEVWFGLVAGTLSLLTVIVVFKPKRPRLRNLHARAWILMLLIIIVLLHGTRMPAEVMIRSVAAYILGTISLCSA